MIRPYVSSKIRLSRLAGLWAQLSGVKWGLEPSKGVEEVENPYSRYDIVEPLVANWLWVVACLCVARRQVWLLPAVSRVGSDPKAPGA